MMRGGVVWSHLLASIVGGLVVAGVLLAFGEIGKQRTETVPITYSSTPPAASGTSGLSSDTAQIYLTDNPGVVYVRATVRRRYTSPFTSGPEDMGVTVTGSGFLIAHQGDKGYILTTYHTIEGADPATGISVDFNADARRHAELIEEDAVNDVALLKVDMKGVPAQIKPLDLGNSRTVSVGDSVMSIANPFGLQRTLAGGIVSALQTQLTGAHGMGINDVLQTDIPSSPGADGGPLMNTAGDVIGINSQIEVESGGSSYAVAFAVPIDTATGSHGIVPKGVLP